MKSRKLTPFILGACLLTAISCGSDDDDNNTAAQQQEENQVDSGTYAVSLTALNTGAGDNNASGIGSITVEGNSIKVKLAMAGTPANITHIQNIFTSTSCPDSSADANGDGFIDVTEGVPYYGQILIPLDGNLDSQSAGAGGYPTSNNLGVFSYNGSGRLDRMIADLRLPDPDITDAVAKLNVGENLNLAGRHIVIHGVPSNTNLPDTVASIGNMPSEATLPIACGVITRVTTGDDNGNTSGGSTTGGTTEGTSTGTPNTGLITE